MCLADGVCAGQISTLQCAGGRFVGLVSWFVSDIFCLHTCNVLVFSQRGLRKVGNPPWNFASIHAFVHARGLTLMHACMHACAHQSPQNYTAEVPACKCPSASVIFPSTGLCIFSYAPLHLSLFLLPGITCCMHWE
jgi:hypothetical protein